MKQLIARLAIDETGVTSIEYAVIAASLSIAIVVVVGELGTEVNTLFAAVKSAF